MPNFDEKTGIRYGVISPHSISSFALDDLCFGANSTDPHYEEGKNEILGDIRILCEKHGLEYEDIDTDQFIDQYAGQYENSDGQYDYTDSDYTLHVSGDNFGIFVMRSPYYTYCRGCSPCVPGAGDLDSPTSPGDFNIPKDQRDFYIARKTLCLGPEWFDQDNDQYSRKIPYRVFRISDDSEVLPGDQS